MRTALHVKFPDRQGKYREFSRFQSPRHTLQLEKPRLLSGFCQNSLLKRSGNFKMLSGNFFAGSGNLPEITGTTARSLFIHGWHSTVVGTENLIRGDGPVGLG